MAPVTVSLILLLLCCAGALADNYGKPPPPPPGKPGICPLTILPSCSLESPPGECKEDKDCHGEQKCCRHLCATKCKAPIHDKPGTCPPPLTKCAGPPGPGTCKVDSECPGNKKCCIKFCSPECIKVN